MGKMSVGGTVKRLMVCSLCGPATIISTHTCHSFTFKPYEKKKLNEVTLHKESHEVEKEHAA